MVLRQSAMPASGRIRVLVVDDSAVIRRLLTRALEKDPQIEVVGSASNGHIALQRIPQLNPDALTLDIEMPQMDGIQTVREIRKNYPRLPVIMFSTLTERGAVATLDALRAGASDYVAKGSTAESLDEATEVLRGEVVPKIKQFFKAAPAVIPEKLSPKRFGANPSTLAPVGFRPNCIRSVVAIGVSTGGPSALEVVIPMFPKNFSLPILIVQHMPPMFTRLLAERLASLGGIQVEEAAEGSVVAAGKALIAPGGFHMRLRREKTRVVVTLDQEPPENSCRPSVDVLFRSVASVYGGGVVAVVLTGMGADGAQGAELLRRQGAHIIAQDEASSVVWGMPRAVVQAGLADSVVDLRNVGPEVLKQI